MKNTAELVDAELDYWLAKALGHVDISIKLPGCMSFDPVSLLWHRTLYSWAKFGPTMAKARIGVMYLPDRACWIAGTQKLEAYVMYGDTALEAAMRTYIAEHIGYSVPDMSQ